jgi:hypothetical protein
LAQTKVILASALRSMGAASVRRDEPPSAKSSSVVITRLVLVEQSSRSSKRKAKRESISQGSRRGCWRGCFPERALAGKARHPIGSSSSRRSSRERQKNGEITREMVPKATLIPSGVGSRASPLRSCLSLKPKRIRCFQGATWHALA